MSDTDDDPGVPILSLPQNLLDQAKIYLNPSPSHSYPTSSTPQHLSASSTESRDKERENDTPSKVRNLDLNN